MTIEFHSLLIEQVLSIKEAMKRLSAVGEKELFAIDQAKAEGIKVGVFPINDKSWFDVGQWEEYNKTVKDLETALNN